MQFSILAAGVLSGLASLAVADDNPSNLCRAVDGSGNVFGAAKVGPVICALRYADQHSNDQVPFPATSATCHPIFCNNGVGIDLCGNGSNKPSLLWGDVRKTVEDAFTGCGGTARGDGKDGFANVPGKAYSVAFQPFQHIDKDWSLTVRAQDCSADGYKYAAGSGRFC